MINQAIGADAQRICLIDGEGFFFRVDSFHVLTAFRIERVVGKLVRTAARIIFREQAGAEDPIGVAIF